MRVGFDKFKWLVKINISEITPAPLLQHYYISLIFFKNSSISLKRVKINYKTKQLLGSFFEILIQQLHAEMKMKNQVADKKSQQIHHRNTCFLLLLAASTTTRTPRSTTTTTTTINKKNYKKQKEESTHNTSYYRLPIFMDAVILSCMWKRDGVQVYV